MARGRALGAILVPLVTLVCCLVATGLLVATINVPVPTSWGFRGQATLFGLTAGSVGAVIIRRQPTNSIGWLFSAIGLAFGVEGAINEYVIVGLLAFPGHLPFAVELGWLLTWIWIPPFIMALVYLPLLFPTGHVLSRRWRMVAWAGVFGALLSSVIISIAPGPIEQATYLDNPLGLAALSGSDVFGILQGLAFGPLAITVIAAMASLALRFRAARGEARQQLKWFAFAAGIAAIVACGYFTVAIAAPQAGLAKVLEVALVGALLSLPVAAGVAILRYRLYEIDRIISRTLAYAVVTGLLAVVFVGIVVGLQAVLSMFTQADTVAVTASTLVVAALFQPLRSRVQRAADRRFNRARYDAERTVAAFAARLRDEVELPTLRDELARVTREALGPAAIAVWIRSAPEAER